MSIIVGTYTDDEEIEFDSKSEHVIFNDVTGRPNVSVTSDGRLEVRFDHGRVYTMGSSGNVVIVGVMQ